MCDWTNGGAIFHCAAFRVILSTVSLLAVGAAVAHPLVFDCWMIFGSFIIRLKMSNLFRWTAIKHREHRNRKPEFIFSQMKPEFTVVRPARHQMTLVGCGAQQLNCRQQNNKFECVTADGPLSMSFIHFWTRFNCFLSSTQQIEAQHIQIWFRFGQSHCST